jgi:hypothetical protein
MKTSCSVKRFSRTDYVEQAMPERAMELKAVCRRF